jgi:hypothetical protein
MKKKRLVHLGGLAVLVLGVFLGCGTNKNLNPQSDLKFSGADPPAMNVGVNPPLTRQAYFLFSVEISDPSLSLIPQDSWTIDGYDLSYVLLSDPGHHLVSLPPSDQSSLKVKVKPYSPTRYPIVLVTDQYLLENAGGFIGTSDTATIKAHVVFRTHRNKDGVRKTVTAKYVLTIGNF